MYYLNYVVNKTEIICFLFFNDKLVICIITKAMHTTYILTYSISVKI